MDPYKKLATLMRHANPQDITLMQGIVKAVSGATCTVDIAGQVVEGVKLRATSMEDDGQLLIIPAVGSAVIFGSLTGDLGNLVVLQVDRAEQIVINGGKLGGLVNIQALTDKLNELVRAFNSHTHLVNTTGSATAQSGTAQAITKQTASFNASDYEDQKITH